MELEIQLNKNTEKINLSKEITQQYSLRDQDIFFFIKEKNEYTLQRIQEK